MWLSRRGISSIVLFLLCAVVSLSPLAGSTYSSETRAPILAAGGEMALKLRVAQLEQGVARGIVPMVTDVLAPDFKEIGASRDARTAREELESLLEKAHYRSCVREQLHLSNTRDFEIQIVNLAIQDRTATVECKLVFSGLFEGRYQQSGGRRPRPKAVTDELIFVLQGDTWNLQSCGKLFLFLHECGEIMKNGG